MNFYFDIQEDSPNYEEEYFYSAYNINNLDKLAINFLSKGVVMIAGDIIDVDGPDKDGDSVRFLIVQRTISYNTISYSLHYTDK